MRSPEDSTRSDDGVTPFTTAPISQMTHAGGLFTLEPQLALVEVAARVPTTNGGFKVRLPSAGVSASYAIDERFSVFTSLYGSTGFSGTFITPDLRGSMRTTLAVGNLGASACFVGCEKEASFRAAASLSLLGMMLRARLASGVAANRPIAADHPLFNFSAFAAALALQAEWRVWDYLSLVPYATVWRLLSVDAGLGADQLRYDPPGRFRASPGLDLWIYIIPESTSHLSAGALVALTEDSPVTIFSLGYAFAL